ncbi:hypothetical protein ABPG74_007322 [Tetrahymena malaccensis]
MRNNNYDKSQSKHQNIQYLRKGQLAENQLSNNQNQQVFYVRKQQSEEEYSNQEPSNQCNDMNKQQKNEQNKQSQNSCYVDKSLQQIYQNISNRGLQQNQAFQGQMSYQNNNNYQQNEFLDMNQKKFQQNQGYGNYQKPQSAKQNVNYIQKKQQYFQENNQYLNKQALSTSDQIIQQQGHQQEEQSRQDNLNKVSSQQSNQFKGLEDQIFLKMKEQDKKNKIIAQEIKQKNQQKNQKNQTQIQQNNNIQSNNNQNIQQQQQNPQAKKQNSSDQQNQNQNNKNKVNAKDKKNNKHKQIEKGFENAYWYCKSCDAKNQWKHDKICLFCNGNKYKSFDRMRKDIGQNDYQYLFFIDFECNSFNNVFEIIEFPLHVVDVTTKEIIESFVSYVKPSNNVTKFITRLTKITNDHVKNAPILQEVLLNVQNFLQKYLEAGIEKCAVVYDCDSDSRFLFSETQRKKIKVPPIFEKFICLKSVFPIQIAKKAPQSLSQMLQQLGLKFEGQQHCGADDSENQARVGLKLLEMGYYFSKQQEVKLGQLSTDVNNELKKKQYEMYKQEYLNEKLQNKNDE